jgi:putative membrane protein
VFGIILVGLGAVMGILSFFRYKTVEHQIDEDTYAPSRVLGVLLTLSLLAIGVFLVLYLVHSL